MTTRPISRRSPPRSRASLAALDFEPEALVASFHGMPQRTLELGDPYHCHCRKTARLLSEALGRPLEVAFQSRFGRAKWLEPATDRVLTGLPGGGVKKVAIFAPGFAADCLETLEELAIRGRDTFLAAGGTRLRLSALPQRRAPAAWRCCGLSSPANLKDGGPPQ